MRLHSTYDVRICPASSQTAPHEASRLVDSIPDVLIADDWDPELDDTEPMLDLPSTLGESTWAPEDEFSEAPTLPGVTPRR